jgi:hypothetical protein
MMMVSHVLLRQRQRAHITTVITRLRGYDGGVLNTMIGSFL